MSQRVKVIAPEFKKSERIHLGKTGVMNSLDRATGQAEVTFDDGETVTINACCLQDQDENESQ